MEPESGYKTGTSARARTGTRVHRERSRIVRFPARMCPQLAASGRASLTRPDPTHPMWSRSNGELALHLRVWTATHPDAINELLD